MTSQDIMSDVDIPGFLKYDSNTAKVRSEAEVVRHQKKGGTAIDVETTSHRLIFRGRQAELVLAHDITEQKKDQKKLRLSEERFAKAFRSSPLAITISTRIDGRSLEVNDAF